MAVSVQNPVITYTANGSVDVFAFPFHVLLADELSVYVNGVEQLTGFTVDDIDVPTGGYVTFTIPPVNGAIIRLQRAGNLSREIDYINGGNIIANTIDFDVDRTVQLIQDLDRVVLKENANGLYNADNKKIVNVPAPTNSLDAVNKQYLDGELLTLSDAVLASRVPAGGTTGQLLTKFSDSDYDTVWSTVENDHTLLTNVGTNTHAAIDSHIADGSLHFTQASISITESQISDLQAYALSSALTAHTGDVANPHAVSAAQSGALALDGSGTMTGVIDTDVGTFNSNVVDGTTAIAHEFNTSSLLSTAGSKLLSIKNNGAEKFSVDKDGNQKLGDATAPQTHKIYSNGTFPIFKFGDGTYNLNVTPYLGKFDAESVTDELIFATNGVTNIIVNSTELTGYSGTMNLGSQPKPFKDLIMTGTVLWSNNTSVPLIQTNLDDATVAKTAFSFNANGLVGGGLTFAGSKLLALQNGSVEKFSVDKDGSVNITDAANIITGTTTGTKLATDATQKLGFWNATPVVQPINNADTSGATLAELEAEVNELKQLLRNIGLMAAT